MKIYELIPDKVLKDALNGAIQVQVSATSTRRLKAYCHADMPNKGLVDEFLTISNNGAIRTMTYPMGVFRGNLAVAVYCKANDNGTAKRDRIGSILQQLQELVENKTYGDFHFSFNANNVITPTTVNSTNGYTTTVVNIEWHTT